MAKNQGQGDGLKHKIKSFLGLRKNKAIPAGVHDDKEADNFIFSPDVLKELSKENNFNHRSRVLRELFEVVSTRRLEEHAVEAVWHEIEDLLQPSVPAEPRQIGLKFLTCLASGQYKKLGLLRAQILRFIENHNVKEDLSHRIELLRVLTDSGKDVSYCEHIGPFLLAFTAEVFRGDRSDDFLQLLINFVHYNSSFLDNEIITGIVEQTCEFCNRAKDEKEIENCLQLLDATVRYGGLPYEGLYPLITTLCRTVNIEKFCQASWKLMKTLVGTRLGHSSIYIMCCILEDENNLTESILLRGAVFFIGMCVWGSKRVSSLQHKPISLLPSFKQALHCNHPIVAHEIGLSLQRLVKKYGKELKIVTWDIIFDLTDMLIKLQQTLPGSNDSLKRTVHDLLTNVEELYNAGKFDGENVRLFAIIEGCSSQRPEASVLTLLSYLNEQIHPAKDCWLEKLKFVMEKYFQKETRTNVRVKVLDMLSAILSSFRFWYEEELVELAVLPYLSNINVEQDSNVRLVTAQLLVDLIVICSSNKCTDLLAIINKLINRPMTSNPNAKKASDDQSSDDERHLRDIQIAVSGLIAAFKQKLFESPPSIAVGILEILVDHVSNHYIHGFMAETGSSVRFEVFRLFLSVRADNLHRIGAIDQNDEDQSKEIRYSVFLTCKANKHQDQAAMSVTNPLRRKLSLTKECPTHRAFDAVLNCLKDEWDWTVLEYVLKNLPDQLQNKTLILGSNSDVTKLCAFLCKMVNDGLYLNKVKNVPSGSGRTELHNLVFPILAVLVTYHDAIEKPRQIELVKSLELGLNSQCARLCVIYLTICTLEMKSIMLRILPSILLRLSKISATVPMSIPMLEFLSSLKEVQQLYSNFVEDQYMSIFAIALPYTDAYRYPPYTVTLAHYVITAWFTRCRLAFRKGFVRLITKGLQSSAIVKPSVAQTGDKPTNTSKQGTSVAETREFHDDMTAVCSDMMAKYSFSTLSNQPKRSSVVEFLLKNGLSQSWLVGNTLVTVTTSGSSSEDCPACAQKRVKVAAAKAAEKLRRMNLAEDTKLQEDNATNQTVDNPEVNAKPARRKYDKPDGAVSAEVKIESPGITESVKDSLDVENRLMKSTLSLEESSDPPPNVNNPVELAEPLTDCHAKHTRVDSAVEMVEEASTVVPPKELSEDALKKDMNSREATNADDEEVSLMNKLALEQQQMFGEGQMFSPSDYLFSATNLMFERGISFTASMESDITGHDQVDDSQTYKPADGESPIKVERETSEDNSEAEARTQENIASAKNDIKSTPDKAGSKYQDDFESPVAGCDEDSHADDKEIGDNCFDNRDAEREQLQDSDAQETSGGIQDRKGLTHVIKSEAPAEIGKSDSTLNLSNVIAQPKDREQPADDAKFNYLRVQPQSQNSSAQVSPIVSRRTSLQTSLQASLQTSIELSSEYELVDQDDASSCKGAEVSQSNDSTPLPLCNCSCEGWAEILIRRPTGNTSWMMKIENVVAAESETGKLGDVISLAASIEGDDYKKNNIGHYFEPPGAETSNTRPRFLSVVSDEMSKDRQSARSSSDSPKPLSQAGSSGSPSTVPRRRFSTGSMDCPGAFWFNLPSPDPNSGKVDESENSFNQKWQFEKPSLGLSPMSSLKRQGSFNSPADFKEKRGQSIMEPSSWKAYQNEDSRKPTRTTNDPAVSGHVEKASHTRQKSRLKKSISSPLKEDKMEPSYSATKASVNQQFTQAIPSGKKEPASASKPNDYSTSAEPLKISKPSNRPILQSSERQPNATAAATTTSTIVRKETLATTEPQEQDQARDGQRRSKQPQPSKKVETHKAGAQTFREKFSSFRPRGQTVSAYPVSKKTANENKEKLSSSENWLKSSLNPYFVFLQFFYSPFIRNSDSERPLLLGSGEVIDRSIKMLDRIPPYDHHKIGIIYVGPDQESNETDILANEFGSSRYIQFLGGLGNLISLPDCCPTEIYTGGLDRNGSDGKFAYSWRDDISQVIFHAATLMPNKASDPACHSKKLHIGNNFVTIVYNDSRKTYNFGTIRGQFNFAEVLIKPLDYQSNVVVVRVKEDLKDIVTNTGPHVISDTNLPVLVRQLAIHTNMATVLHHSRKKSSDAYGCNWLERLKQIKRIRSKAVGETQVPSSSSLASSKAATTGYKSNDNVNSDFTDYT